MQQADETTFNQALNIAFDNCLGLCQLASEREVFPLTGRYARQFAAHRLALVGDAAHTIHPLAGQGVNLGFMDAAELIDELRRLHAQGKDIGQHLYLRRYERRKDITFADITQRWVQGFCNYLDREECNMRVRNGSRPLSPNSKHEYFCKLKTALRQAYNDGIIRDNPTRGTNGFHHEEVTREYLTIEEIRALAATDCDYPEVKRAFLFSCLTGLRRSDVERLTWDEVMQLDGRTRLVFRQKKTGGQEYLDITPQAAQLIGTRGTASGDSNVFGSILAPPSTNKALRTWTQRAGISKHITFHCARHTFAVLMLTLDTDIYTVSKLLGHRELRTTQIYAKIVDRKKQQAVDNIPDIF